MINYSEIVNFIIKTVQEESIESGFQLIVYNSKIESRFNIKLDDSLIKQIEEELWQREEVADVICEDNAFDVVLYTAYAPNYIAEEITNDNNKGRICYNCGYNGDSAWYSIIIEYKDNKEDNVSDLYPADDVEDELGRIIENNKDNKSIKNIFISGGFCPFCLSGDFD